MRVGTGPVAVVNFAAESHVDRSLFTGIPFVMANTVGVQVLLEALAALVQKGTLKRFLQVSTDEVYGDVPLPHRSVETRSDSHEQPVFGEQGGRRNCWCRRSCGRFSFPAVITRCSNNYGPVALAGEDDSAVHHAAAGRARKCRCMAMACSGGTGFTWKTMRRAFWRRC